MKGTRSIIAAAVGGAGEEAARPPFASYAQVIRMMMPLARKVAFHDPKGNSLWTSDDVVESELDLQVQLLLARHLDHDLEQRRLNAESDLPEPVHVFPVRDRYGTLTGALAVQFGELPPGAAYRQYSTVQRVLKPLLDILAHDWQFELPPIVQTPSAAREPAADMPPAEIKAASLVLQNSRHASTSESTSASTLGGQQSPPDGAQKVSAALRRMLASASELLECAFGTVVIPGYPFLLTHRMSADESDLNVDAATSAVRTHLLRLMAVRHEPLLINASHPSQSHFSAYKFVAWPIRLSDGPLLALVVLFRPRTAANFVRQDLSWLQQVITQLPAEVLDQLQQLQKTTTTPQAVRAQPVVSVVTAVERSVKPSVPLEPSEPLAPAVMTELESMPNLEHIAPAASLAERLRAALKEDGFDLYVQRITPLHSYQRPDRYEVLLRMPSKLGTQAAGTFVGVAEESGLMPALDRWVIRRLLLTLRDEALLDRNNRREFCINLSAHSLRDNQFREAVLAEIHGGTIWPGQLVFEIAEKTAVAHQRMVRSFAESLRDAGCRIALDNCHMGLDLFELTEQWPVSCIKIDGSLIRRIGTDVRASALIQTMTHLAAGRGIDSTAEQVETQRVCNALRGAGLDYAQGFHLEEPRPLASLYSPTL